MKELLPTMMQSLLRMRVEMTASALGHPLSMEEKDVLKNCGIPALEQEARMAMEALELQTKLDIFAHMRAVLEADQDPGKCKLPS